jgi:hypothetical protein
VSEDDLNEVAGRPVFEELFRDLISGTRCAWLGDHLPVAGPRRAKPRHGRLVAGSLAALVASLTVAFAVASGVDPGPSLPKGSFTTPWRPSVPASTAPAPNSARAAPDGFRLASYVTAAAPWSLAKGPAGLFTIVTCPTVSACYLSLTTPVRPSHVGTSLFYFSGDGGSSWARLPLPSGLTFGSAPSCPSPDVCVIAAALHQRIARTQVSVLASTVDGGHRWSVVPAAFSARLFLLSCTTASVCSGITTSAAGEERLVRTTNGGATWSTTLSPPASSEIYALTCPSRQHCVATGAYKRAGASMPSDFAIFSNNRGGRWEQARMDGAPAPGLLTALSCANASDCTAVSAYNALIAPLLQPGATPSGPAVGPPRELYTLRSNVADTVNGGKTWHVQAFNLQNLASAGAAVGISAMVCPSEGARLPRCWPPTAGGAEPPPTPWMAWVLLASQILVIGPAGFDCPASGHCALAGPWGLGLTANGGRGWALPTLPGDSLIIQGHTPMVSVSCPSQGQCVAVSEPSGDGLAPTPIYSSILHS